MAAPVKTVPRITVPREIVGPRVRLRSLRPSDAPAVWDAVEESRKRLERWLPWVHHTHSAADERRAIAGMRGRWRRREDFLVGIFDRLTGRYLGGSGLHKINWERRCFEIGYWIRAGAEGKGYVSEAVRLLTCFAFDRLGAARVEIFMHPRNVRSEAVAKRLGFVYEGTARAVTPGPDGRLEDRHMYALVRADYARISWASGRRSGRRPREALSKIYTRRIRFRLTE
ncbi:MAG TPA: GNAT family protein [bacterium]|nr:GNAT family protein [bacterium]